MSDEVPMAEIGKRLGDLNDLPEALRKQLSTTRLDDLEEKIVGTLRHRFNGIASQDEIMVGLYRDYGHVVEDRKSLYTKLFRMVKAGHRARVGKRSGIVKLP